MSTYNTEFPFDFGLAMTEEQAQQIPEIKAMVEDPPAWLDEWSHQIGGELKDGLREGPGWIAFARENGTVYHTYTVMAPDPFVAPTSTSCSTARPSPSLRSPAPSARTSTRTPPSRAKSADRSARPRSPRTQRARQS